MIPTCEATRPREDAGAAERIARSAATTGQGAHLPTSRLGSWLEERRKAHEFRVERVPLRRLRGWSFETASGNLVHRTGRFFSVEGLHVQVNGESSQEWQQPVMNQPETGILGILAKEFDGVLHLLMQAKMEPGNPELIQLSPTVQATRSNYTRVHQGANVPYLDYFTRRGRGKIITDVLQSEHGSWFYRKSNRNMVVEAADDVPLRDDFCWLTLGQLHELLQQDNTVNMDSRTVLSCLPCSDGPGRARLPDTELRSWIAGERSRNHVRARLVPLADVSGWTPGDTSIAHDQGRYFKVIGVSVTAGSREVAQWAQPLFEPVGRGITAFLTRMFDGVLHVLARARLEGGFLDRIELGPTVQCTPGNYAHLPEDARPAFLDEVLAADPARIRYEAVHAEEGGRLFHAESRCLLIDADEAQVPLEPPPGFAWVTPAQLSSLLRHGHYVNVQARTLLACLYATGDRRARTDSAHAARGSDHS